MFQFREWVDKDQILKLFLEHRQVTVFAPVRTVSIEYGLVRSDLETKIASYHVGE